VGQAQDGNGENQRDPESAAEVGNHGGVLVPAVTSVAGATGVCVARGVEGIGVPLARMRG
jgi:hypothetical protein